MERNIVGVINSSEMIDNLDKEPALQGKLNEEEFEIFVKSANSDISIENVTPFRPNLNVIKEDM